jgi:hypothetical protein
VRLAVDQAAALGIPARSGPTAEALLTAVIDAGGAWPDFASVIEAFNP